MMTGSPGWGELFMQDPVTKQSKKVGVVEELTTKCLGTEYCIVTDNWLSYNMYDEWIECHFPDYKDDFVFEHDHDDIKPDRLYKIIGKAPHLESHKTMLYLIQDMDTEQVFIIEEEGIKKTTTATIKHYTTTLRCDKLDTTISCNIKGGERDMNNKIIDLYYERKKEGIIKKYENLVKGEYEELDVVKEYQELTKTFEASLAEIANRYNNEETRMLVRTGYARTYIYELSDNLKDEIKESHREEYNAEIRELELLVEEVRAVLSVSDTDEYRLGVLKEYGIIDKKGKLNI